MRYTFSVLVAGLLLFGFQTSSAQTTIQFDDFSDVSDLALNFDAAQANNGTQDVLRITPAASGQRGSAFLTDPITLANQASFSTFFTFQITNSGGASDNDGPGADGLVFVVQTNSNTAGGAGGGIGYQGIDNSVGIEFDTWNNGGADINGNHVAINTDGNLNAPLASAAVPDRMNDGDLWYAWIDYDGSTQELSVRLSMNDDTRPATPLLTATLDLATILGQTDAFVGFTSGTGAAWGNHDILNWTFTNDFQPIGDDDTPPVCSAVQLGDGPFDGNLAAFVTAQDPESGIAKLTYKLKNANGFYDAGGGTEGPFSNNDMVQFDVPVTDAITIGGEKMDASKRARVVVMVENAEGLVSTCDPVMTTLGGEQPAAFRLERAYPNPFNPSTTLGFAVPEAAHVELAVYDLLGRRVATLVNESVSAGRYEVQWDGRSDAGEVVAGGVYLARLAAGSFVQTQQLTLLK